MKSCGVLRESPEGHGILETMKKKSVHDISCRCMPNTKKGEKKEMCGWCVVGVCFLDPDYLSTLPEYESKDVVEDEIAPGAVG